MKLERLFVWFCLVSLIHFGVEIKTCSSGRASNSLTPSIYVSLSLSLSFYRIFFHLVVLCFFFSLFLLCYSPLISSMSQQNRGYWLLARINSFYRWVVWWPTLWWYDVVICKFSWNSTLLKRIKTRKTFADLPSGNKVSHSETREPTFNKTVLFVVVVVVFFPLVEREKQRRRESESVWQRL